MDIPPLYKDYNHLVPNDNDDIIYIGGKDYLDLFYKLTSKLSNRKIIYYNSNIMPENHDGNYIYRKYLSNYPTNWHYQLADDICNGIIPQLFKVFQVNFNLLANNYIIFRLMRIKFNMGLKINYI